MEYTSPKKKQKTKKKKERKSGKVGNENEKKNTQENLSFASCYVKIKEYYLHTCELYISNDVREQVSPCANIKCSLRFPVALRIHEFQHKCAPLRLGT